MFIKSNSKKSSKIFTILAFIGLLFILTGTVTAYIANEEGLASRLGGFGAGMGCSLIFVSTISLIINGRKSEQQLKKEQNQIDERFIRIREKASFGSFFVSIFSMLVAIITFLCLNNMPACFITIVLLFIHIISYSLFIFRYNKIL